MTTTPSLLEDSTGSGARFYFDIVRSGFLDQISVVAWSVTGTGSSPVSATDFINGVFPSGSVTFQPGQTTVTIFYDVAGDNTLESDETFSVVLSGASAGTSITTSAATGTILNDDALLSIASAQSTNWEGNSGTTPLTFTVTRSGYITQATTMDWSVVGTGANPADAADFSGYNGLLPSGKVSFAAGESAKTITVNVAGDTNIEALQETFNVVLGNASAGASIGTSSAAGSIGNDDGTPQLSISPATLVLSEGDNASTTTAYSFTITRSVNLSGASSVNWAVTGTNANPTDAADFSGGVLPSGTVSFAQNQSSKTVTVFVAQDRVYELNETFALTLSRPTNAAISGSSSVTGTITNDDTNWKLAYTSAADSSKTEGNTGFLAYSYTVTRVGPDLRAASVIWSVAGVVGNPANATDFSGYNGQLPSGTLSFLAGEVSKTFAVNVAGDSTVEPDEAFRVTITPANTALPIYPGASAVTSTIVSDDAGVSVIAGTTANDTINGTSGNDTIYGFSGDDLINGMLGDDYLDGGEGADILTGGQGNDSIVLTEITSAADVVIFSGGSGTTGTTARAQSLGLDTITGLALGTNTTAVDKLQFSAADFAIPAGPAVQGSASAARGGPAANTDGNFYILTAAPTQTGVDLNGNNAASTGAIVFVGATSGTAGVNVWFTTNEASFSTTNSVQIATLVGVNTANLNTTDLLFIV